MVLRIACKFAVRGLRVNGETAPINVHVGFEVDVPAFHRGRRGNHVTSVGIVDAIVVVDNANVVNCPIVGVIGPLLFTVNDTQDTDSSSSLFPHILRGETKVSSVHSFRGLVLVVCRPGVGRGSR